ncbi:MAG: MlaA family lipoprotein [Cellvibrionaceae bacterium]
MSSTLKKCLLLVILLPLIVACASTSKVGENSAGNENVNTDPYEGLNRAIFSFNNGIDKIFLKPVAKGYKFVTPDLAEAGVSNFFSNLLEIRNIVNAGLQGKGEKTLTYTWRFIVNSTFGLFGLLDVASEMGLETEGGEDFGQTLAAWGVKSGPYIVMPFLGPSTLRDGFAIPVDSYLDPANYVEHNATRNALTFTEIVSIRASLLDTEKLLSGDRYVFIRDAYLQRRDYLVNDGKVKDTFGDSLGDDKDF